MTIPQLDLKAEYNYLKKDIDKNLKSCLNSHQWILGPKVRECEEEISRYLKAKYVVGVASGTDALLLSLRAIAQIKRNKARFLPGDEIITTPFTFVATAEAIVRSGAKPVFVDIDAKTYNIDPLALEKAVNKNTVGIMPVHIYGLACDMGRIRQIAKKNDLFIIEDCAQSFGGGYKGRKLGTLGDCGAFSFFPSKNLGAFGDAGCISTDNKKTADYLKSLRHHGQVSDGDVGSIGYNSRLDTIQAAIILAKLKYIDRFNKVRRKIAEQYNGCLKNQKYVLTPYVSKESFHVYGLYTIRALEKRDQLVKFLNSRGVGARVYYKRPLTDMKIFRSSKVKKICRNAQQASNQVLSLPMHPFLKESDISYITKSINIFYK